MDTDLVILVDEHDRELGLKDKLDAHRDGDLHRAISVFLFDSGGRMLLQRRATGKYHSGGLWTNACCSHPKQGEHVQDAAVRRLKEEIGINCNNLEPAFSFLYKADVGNNLTEHELDHVFIGSSDALPSPDPQEVMDYRYTSPGDIEKDLREHPEHYTTWFRLVFDRVKQLRESPDPA
jgi:isopentenyl-diphosphate delta-isomerase